MRNATAQNISELLNFTGSWRSYQQSVLDELDHYTDDSKIHIIAAPGAGKTVLGIELVRRVGHPALVLTPRVSIQRQWIESCANLFLGGNKNSEYFSTDPDRLGLFSVLTYQSVKRLLSTMKKGKGEATEAPLPITLVLDECHHLTGAWAKDVVALQQIFDVRCIVSLTATPPYEVDVKKWEKFQEICGNVDVEISVPELVQHQSLCPHQDFIYASHPSADEDILLTQLATERDNAVEEILARADFDSLLEYHLGLFANADNDFLIQHTRSYIAILALCQLRSRDLAEKIEQDHAHAPKPLPQFTVSHLEIYLNYVFSQKSVPTTLRNTVSSMKEICIKKGVLDPDGVQLITPPAITKVLETSASKLTSIQNIVLSEYQVLKDSLRQLVLLDFIGADALQEEKNSENDDSNLSRLTAVAAFHALYQCLEKTNLPMAMVSGQLAIIPDHFADLLIEEGVLEPRRTTTPKEAIEPEEEEKAQIEFEAFYIVQSGQKGFESMEPRCTEWLKNGDLKILVGTGSLLGEGWDCPSVNSLILASQIGSFVSSNQMRGRAIRKFENHPAKVSNIWHLITLNADDDVSNRDLNTLKRRFNTFVGPSYKDDKIMSGISRVQLGDGAHLIGEKNNTNVLALSAERALTSEKWQKAIALGTQSILAQKIDVERLQAPKRLLVANLFKGKGVFSKIVNPLIFALLKPKADSQTILVQRVIKNIVKALYECGFISTKPRKFKIMFSDKKSVCITGGLQREVAIITNAVDEFFTFSTDTRYALALKIPLSARCYVFAPKLLSDNKKRLEVFLNYLERVFGHLDPIFLQGKHGEELKLKLLQDQELAVSKNEVNQGRVWL